MRRAVSVFLAGIVLCSGGVAQAADMPPPQGLTVSPAIVNLLLPKGAKSAESAVSVRNDTPQTLRYTAHVEGAELATNGSLVPSGGPHKVLEPILILSQRNFSLEPKQSVNLKLRLEDSPSLAPGGHYAVLLVSQVDKGNGTIAVLPAIGVTLFVGKESGAIRKLGVAGIETDGTIFRLPRNVTATFKNEGNIDIVPRAAISITRPDGSEVSLGVLNEASVRAMPARSITLQSPVRTIADSWIPGRHTVSIRYRYDGTDTQQTATQEVWYVPPGALLFIPLLGLLAYGGWWLARWWLGRRRKSPAKAEPHAVSQTKAPEKLPETAPKKAKARRAVSVKTEHTDEGVKGSKVVVRRRKRRKV
jgi:hypothetical protein